MKVLMFGWEYPPFNSGGLGVACEGLAQALADRGEDVTFVLPKKVPVHGNGIKFVFADIPNKTYEGSSGAYPATFITKEDGTRVPLYGMGLIEDVLAFRNAAYDLAKKIDFDVIHAHDWLSFGAGISAKEVSGKPLVAHIHATEHDRTGGLSKNELVYSFEKEGFQKADRIVAVSHYTKKMVEKEYTIPSDKISVVHNGLKSNPSVCNARLDLSHLKENGKKIVLFVGRLTLQKGPDYFIRAAKKVLSLRKDILFLIVGSGDMERKLIQEVSYSGFSDKIQFLGFLRGEELKCVSEAADLCVMPSVSEPFGIVPLELLDAGTPVIISKQSGVGEVLLHALKVDFWDTDEMTNQIIAAISHTALSTQLREYGGKEARAQTWSKAAGKCVEIYNSLIPSFA
jgi:glycosyltransferase involved in cell wall biosynthesis